LRKLIVVSMMSLDGFYAGPDGDLMLLPFDGGAFDTYNLERIQAANTVLLGTRSYKGFSDYWPAVVHDEGASAASRRFSSIYNEVEKVVVSDSTSLPAEGHPWAATTRIVPRAGAREEVARLKEQNGGEIVTWGSRTLWQDLLRYGLVDELHLMVGAITVGDGIGLFDSAWKPDLRLIDAQAFDGSDDVLLTYQVAPHLSTVDRAGTPQ
jgi:dihydrofolate reductase